MQRRGAAGRCRTHTRTYTHTQTHSNAKGGAGRSRRDAHAEPEISIHVDVHTHMYAAIHTEVRSLYERHRPHPLASPNGVPTGRVGDLLVVGGSQLVALEH
eukprot:GHVU01033357.1.p2 GENE.GHVU01033357.1~~GHVU01033357.1.p2  ORF type:complete len:101 (+),score=6.97 GHVU01033357.1:1320-1622(+)